MQRSFFIHFPPLQCDTIDMGLAKEKGNRQHALKGNPAWDALLISQLDLFIAIVLISKNALPVQDLSPLDRRWYNYYDYGQVHSMADLAYSFQARRMSYICYYGWTSAMATPRSLSPCPERVPTLLA
jgi:hypothetical protein